MNVAPAPPAYGERTGLALGFMLFSTLLASGLVPALALAGAEQAVFLFSALWRLGLALGLLSFLFLCCRPGLAAAFGRGGLVWSSCRRPYFWGGLLWNFEFVFAAAAAVWVDYLLIAVIVELWVLTTFLLMPWALGGLDPAGRRRRALRSAWPWVLLALAGAALAAFSMGGSGGGETAAAGGGGLGSLLLGCLLALGGAGSAACVIFAFRLGADWGGELRVGGGRPGGLSPAAGPAAGLIGAEGFALILATAVLAAIGFLLNLVLAAVFGSVWGWDFVPFGAYWPLLIVGLGFYNAAPVVFYRLANVLTTRVGLNAWHYLILPLSLVWLGFFDDGVVARPGLLAVGAGLALLANFMTGRAGGGFGGGPVKAAVWPGRKFLWKKAAADSPGGGRSRGFKGGFPLFWGRFGRGRRL